MRKSIIGIAILLLTVVSVSARDKNYGVRLGYLNNTTSLDGDKVGKSGNSFFVNAYKDTKMLPFLYFQSGLQYTQNQSTIDGQDYKLNYLGVPLAIKAKVGPVFALGGAAFNVKLKETSAFDSSSKWYDTNAFVGAGFKVLFMTIDARYMWGLTDINNGYNNNSFQIGLGLRF